jgi:hypothetical protein
MRSSVSLLPIAAIALALGACGLSERMGRQFKSFLGSDRTVAVATFDENRLPIAPGSEGIIVGYIPTAEDGPKAATFTYRVRFHIEMGRWIEGRGERIVFFNPGGAHASFLDPDSFSRGQAVESDTVKLTGEYVPEDSRLMLQMRICRTAFEPVQFAGHRIEAPEDEPWIFQGRWRDNVGGWMFSGTPSSF